MNRICDMILEDVMNAVPPAMPAARKLRFRGGARAVGYAMAACPNGRGIPWHRVVGAGGRLIIREPYGSLQRRLLETEGVTIEGRRIDMERYAWAPKKKSAGRKRATKR